MAGLYGGYWYEKNKLVAMNAIQVTNFQKQISDLKMKAQVAPTAAMMENTVYAMKNDAKLGQYLTDIKGMTLYTFDKDSNGVSNCTGNCATIWLPYTAASQPASMPQNTTTIKRAEGSWQYAYKGMPLYYYKSDLKPGDTLGDGVGGVWHVAK